MVVTQANTLILRKREEYKKSGASSANSAPFCFTASGAPPAPVGLRTQRRAGDRRQL